MHDVGRTKAESAYETLTGINPEIEVEALVETISEDNIDQLLQGCDLIMDAMDNFPVRYLLNRAALQRKIPLFHGAISGYQGQATTIIPGKTACLACIFPRAPPGDNLSCSGQHLRCDRLHSGDRGREVCHRHRGSFWRTVSCSGMG